MNILNRRTNERLYKLALKVLDQAPLSPEDAATLERRGLVAISGGQYPYELTKEGRAIAGQA